MYRPLRSLVLAALAPVLAGCASSPSRVTVVYEQQQSGLRQTLLTEDVVSAREFYSSKESDEFAKVLTTEQMQVLLDALTAYGFFDYARPDTPGGAVSTIRVQIEDRRQVWAKSAAMELSELNSYHQAMAAFLNIYNATDSFHAGRGGEAALEDAERLRRRYEEMRRKSETGESGLGSEREKGQP